MAFNPDDIVKKTTETQKYKVITSDDQKTKVTYYPETCPIANLTFDASSLELA